MFILDKISTIIIKKIYLKLSNIMFESSVDSEFKGPIPPLLSSRVGFQEGDL